MSSSELQRTLLEGTVGKLSQAILAGEISFLEGCIDLLAAGYKLDLYDDPDFLIIDEVVSKTKDLPIGPERIHWSEASLKNAEPEIREKEQWAKKIAGPACEAIARRFAP